MQNDIYFNEYNCKLLLYHKQAVFRNVDTQHANFTAHLIVIST